MQKIIFSLFLALFSASAFSDLLIIGDSHPAGPFGEHLHKELSKNLPNEIILTFGHSSSAPLHWMSKHPTKLSGGLNHHFSIDGKYYPHPNLPDWRILADSLYLWEIFEAPILHQTWRKYATRVPQFDTIIIALGANDKAAVSDLKGNKQPEYQRRLQILKDLLTRIQEKNLKCIWIAPPSSAASSNEAEEITFQYLAEGISSRCPIYDSRKFRAVKCDQVHFNCSKEISIAKIWAEEVNEFVLKNL